MRRLYKTDKPFFQQVAKPVGTCYNILSRSLKKISEKVRRLQSGGRTSGKIGNRRLGMKIQRTVLPALAVAAVMTFSGCAGIRDILERAVRTDWKTAASEERTAIDLWETAAHDEMAGAELDIEAIEEEANRPVKAEEVEDILELEPGTALEPQEDADRFFAVFDIPEDVFAFMDGRSFKEGGQIMRTALKYLRVLYVDYEGIVRVGELVVNVAAADAFLGVMRELYAYGYPIHKMVLVDNYYDLPSEMPWLDRDGGSDEASIEDNNTSAFNYRMASNNAASLSNHALGTAIDLNPYENPYVNPDGTVDGPAGSYPYADRTGASMENHMMSDEDFAVITFKKYGFSWGGDWAPEKDYQHFDWNGAVLYE